MRLHTSLTYTQVCDALNQVKHAGQVTEDVRFMVMDRHGSRTHPRAFEVQLGTWCQTSLPEGYRDQDGKLMHVRRFKNTGNRGASSGYGCDEDVWSATWHEWGWFMARVFNMDPHARFGSLKGWHYDGYGDFMRKTNEQFTVQRLLSPEWLEEARKPGGLMGPPENLDYLPAREHDMRAFGQLLPDEDYSQYDSENALNHDTVREQTGGDA
jgi:hypothetical protein